MWINIEEGGKVSKSKNDLLLVMRLFQNFIQDLSSIEMENLINGRGSIRYMDKKIPLNTKQEFDGIVRGIVRYTSEEEVINKLKTYSLFDSKHKYLEFCDYLNINVKSKESINSIEQKLAHYILENKEAIVFGINSQSDINSTIQNISYALEEFNDPQSAFDFLKNNEVLLTKNNLMLLSKQLNVYLEKDLSTDAIIKKIVDAVVVAKLRSLAIRNTKDIRVNKEDQC
jgi:predicted metal-binding transcription factor (methanogenesis marker protein 9)